VKSTLPLINLDPPLPTSGRMSRGRLGREILINYSLDLTLEIYSGKVGAVAATCETDDGEAGVVRFGGNKRAI
jgi:hypothetical protein